MSAASAANGMLTLRRVVPQRSLPPEPAKTGVNAVMLGGEAGRGVVANAECAAKPARSERIGATSLRELTIATSVLVATPIPVPPPQGGRERCGTDLRKSNIEARGIADALSYPITSIKI